MFTFGDDSGGFDWGSLITPVVQTAGQVTAAVINSQNQASSGYVYNPNAINPATGQPYGALTTTSTGMSSSTLLLLGAVGLVAFLILRKKKGKRS